MPISLFGDDLSGDNFAKRSYSGLPEGYRNNVLDQTVPQFLDSLTNYNQNVDENTQAATDLYESQTRNAINGGGVQQLLNNLSNRGVLKSKVGGEALGDAMFKLVNEGATKAHESALTGAGLKMKQPELFGSAVNMGQYSETKDPLAPYSLLADLYKSMM